VDQVDPGPSVGGGHEKSAVGSRIDPEATLRLWMKGADRRIYRGDFRDLVFLAAGRRLRRPLKSRRRLPPTSI